MPIIKSSMKDVRRIKRRTARNQSAKSAIRTAIKSVRNAATADLARAALRNAMKVLDKAASNGVIPVNTASRQKARLSSMVHKKFAK
jgi:small subunit ribosomal protein S20